MKISFVIPAYNEADNICQTISEIDNSFKKSPDTGINHEIIVVDDCSSDETFSAITDQKYPHVTVLRLSRRSGSHVALRAGLQKAKGESVICMAADGQDNPAVLNQMIEKWKSGFDVVWALRKTRNNEPFVSRVFTNIFYTLLKWFNDPDNDIDLSRADFYLLNRNVVSAINLCQEKNTSLFGLIIWLGFRQSYVDYHRKERRYGSSKWNLRSKLTLAKDWIIAFSGIPLRLLTYSGFLIAGIGSLYAFFIIISSIFFGSPVQGWSSVMTVILILGGGQAIMLGIIGEYLWRTMDESRNRPIYFIEKLHLPDEN